MPSGYAISFCTSRKRAVLRACMPAVGCAGSTALVVSSLRAAGLFFVGRVATLFVAEAGCAGGGIGDSEPGVEAPLAGVSPDAPGPNMVFFLSWENKLAASASLSVSPLPLALAS